MDTLRWWLLGMLAVASGCSTSHRSAIVAGDDNREWKGIAAISGTDSISKIHITNLLLSHEIKSQIYGSLMYGVSVPAANAEEASKLLRADAHKLGYFVMFKRNDVVKAAPLIARVSRSEVEAVLKKPEYSSDTDLGRFLRSEDIAKVIARYSYVVSLSVHERQYLATPKTFKTGYDVRLELQKSFRQNDAGYSGHYQVYEDGGRVSCLGSSEWTAGKKQGDG